MEKQTMVRLLKEIKLEIIKNTENEIAIDLIKNLKLNNYIDDKLYKILEKTEICLKKNAKRIAINYINLEIENLEGVTEMKCKNTKYYYYDYYCKYCNNLNCNSNKK